MELAPLLAGEVDPGDAHAHLEAQRRGVAQRAGHGDEVLAADEEGQLATVDDDLLDGVRAGSAVADEGLPERVGDLVEVRAVRALRWRRGAGSG